jgi:hypothetical protein
VISQTQSLPTENTNLAAELDIPGFNSVDINLFEREILTIPIPILSSNYAVAWTGNFSNGSIIAQSRSEIPVTVDPCKIPAGDQILTATVYHPLDNLLFLPLASQDVNLSVEKACSGLSFEQASLPSVTENNSSRPLVIWMWIENENGELVLDSNGNRPPVKLTLTPAQGVIDGSPTSITVVTDAEGFYRGQAILTRNLGTMTINIQAEYEGDPEDPGDNLFASTSLSMRDVCETDNDSEEGNCPGQPSPTPSPTPTPEPTGNTECIEVSPGVIDCRTNCVNPPCVEALEPEGTLSLTVEISKVEVEENEQVTVTFNGIYTNGEGVAVPDQPITYFVRPRDSNGFTPINVGVTTTTGSHQTTISLLENLGSANFLFDATTVEQETGIIVSSESYLETISDSCNSDNPLEAPCDVLEITQLNLPENTNDGVGNTLYVAVKHTDKDGTPILNRDVTYTIDNFIGDATVIGETGTTNTGDYQATVRLNENLGVAVFAVTASTPSLDGTTTLSDSKTVATQDPCDEGDPAEEPCEDQEEENSFSDPNYRSFDSLYSWTNSEGDFILARTLDGQVEIQARQEKLNDTNGDSRNTDFAIRDGSDVLEFNLAQSISAPGLILANGQLLDLTKNPSVFNSGLFVSYTISTFAGLEVPVYRVRTSTGDTFRVSARAFSLTLGSKIVSKGQFEGILGNADGDPSNDWTPRGGSPLAVRDYTTREFGDFIESWRVTGDQSLFASPFGSFIIDFDDWWSNRLSPEQIRAGFQLYEELFGSIDNPFLAFRFAVDLAGGLPAVDLQDLYERVSNLQEPPPIPPIDADLNRNGTPDVEEPQLWVFDNLLTGDEQQCINEGGFFNIETGECLPGFQDCQFSGGFFNTDTGECLPGFQNCQFSGGIFDTETGECSFENIDCQRRGGVYDLEAEACSFPNCPLTDIEAADLRLDPISPIGEFPFRFLALLTDPITRDLLFPFGQQPPLPILDFIAEGGYGDGPAEPFANNFGEIILLGNPRELELTDEWRMRIGCGPVVFDIAGGAYLPEEPFEDESILDELICDYPAEIIEDFYNPPGNGYCDFM